MLRHTDIRAYLSFLLIHVARKSALLTTYRIPHTSINTLTSVTSCCLGKQWLFVARTVQNTQINNGYLLHGPCRTHKSTIAICSTDRAEHTDQQWLFVARTVQNTQINNGCLLHGPCRTHKSTMAVCCTDRAEHKSTISVCCTDRAEHTNKRPGENTVTLRITASEFSGVKSSFVRNANS
jgi:hypothetical protein